MTSKIERFLDILFSKFFKEPDIPNYLAGTKKKGDPKIPQSHSKIIP